MPRQAKKPAAPSQSAVDLAFMQAIRTPICEFIVHESLQEMVDRGCVSDLIDPKTGRATPELKSAVALCPMVSVNDEGVAILDAPDEGFALDILNDYLVQRVEGFAESFAIAATGATSPDVRHSMRSVEGRHRDTVIKFGLSPAQKGVPARVLMTVFDVTEQERVLRNFKAHQEQLELAVKTQRENLARTEMTLSATIELILAIVATRDLYTSEHMRAVGDVAVEIARELDCDETLVADIYTAGLMHDVGKLAIPASILSKPGPLTSAEMILMRDHVHVGYDLLSKAGFKPAVTTMVIQHHERWDGSGYPEGLTGEAISLGARIVTVADVTVGMRFPLPYRPALSLDEILTQLRSGRGTLFDPDCTDATIAVLRQPRRA